MFESHNISRPKIMIVSTFYLPMPGAVWRRLSYFAEYLSSRDFQVFVLGAFSPTREMIRLPIRLTVKRSGTYQLFNFQLRVNMLGWHFLIPNILGSLSVLIVALIRRPNVLLVSLPAHDVLPIAYVAAKLSRSKLVIDVRDPLEYLLHASKGFSRRLYSLLIKLDYVLMRKANLVITVTPGLAKWLAKHGIRAHLVMNGADTRVFRPRFQHESPGKIFLSKNKLILVFNGYLGNYYDAIPLLQGIAKLPDELKRKTFMLVVGGFMNASYAKKFIRVTKELHLSSNIKVMRPIQDAPNLAEILSVAKAGVITLVASELFDLAIPAKFYEYLACGLPIIVVSRRGSDLWRLTTKWGVGFACEPHDLDCITKAIQKIFDEGTIGSIRANVLRVRPLIDRRRGAEKLYCLICELLK
jgi:glycosyltransferase involved in cell wall biosynthesis